MEHSRIIKNEKQIEMRKCAIMKVRRNEIKAKLPFAFCSCTVGMGTKAIWDEIMKKGFLKIKYINKID